MDEMGSKERNMEMTERDQRVYNKGNRGDEGRKRVEEGKKEGRNQGVEDDNRELFVETRGGGSILKDESIRKDRGQGARLSLCWKLDATSLCSRCCIALGRRRAMRTSWLLFLSRYAPRSSDFFTAIVSGELTSSRAARPAFWTSFLTQLASSSSCLRSVGVNIHRVGGG